jgi:hypothetical protein
VAAALLLADVGSLPVRTPDRHGWQFMPVFIVGHAQREFNQHI